MKNKLDFEKICEYLIYLYIIVIMVSSSAGEIFVKGTRVVVFFCLLARIIIKKKIYKSWYILWAALFIAFNVIMVKYSYNTTISYKYTLSLIYVLVINVLICQYIIEKKIYVKLFKCIIVGTLLKCTYIFTKNGPFVFLNSRKSDEASANIIGIYSAISFTLNYYLNKRSNKENKRMVYIFLSVVFIIFTILSASRKAIIFIIPPFIIYNIVKSKNVGKTIINILLVLILLSSVIWVVFNVPVVYELVGNRIESMISGFNGEKTDSSTSTRMYLIEEGIEWFKEKPLLGNRSRSL